MRIGYFSARLPYPDGAVPAGYEYGGAERATARLASEIAGKGHDVRVFTTSATRNDGFSRSGTLEVRRYATIAPSLPFSLSPGLFSRPSACSLDLVHVSFDLPPAPFAGLRYAEKTQTPLVVMYHGDWDAGFGSPFRRLGVSLCNRFLVGRLLSAASRIIVPSPSYPDVSASLSPYRDKTVAIPNGIDATRYAQAPSRSRARELLGLPADAGIILFLSNLVPYKGPDILLSAFADLAAEDSSAVLVFAGDGRLSRCLKEKAERLGLSGRVIFTGYIGEEEKPLYFRAADIFCLPSTGTTESFGIVNLEAMAAGTPIVASRTGGIPDVVVDQKTGLLVPPADAKALCSAIRELLDDRMLAARLGEEGALRARSYSWDAIAERTLALYREVAGD
jgi:glycosyltransferase involved in cell wall biosynthesis